MTQPSFFIWSNSAVADALPNEEIVESEEAPDTAETDVENQ